MTRPLITTDPAVNGGRPIIGSAPVGAVCQRIWAGEPLGEVAEDYGISRGQALVACWHQARYGTRTWQLRWRDWLAAAEVELWRREYDAIPDPPTKEAK